MKKIALFQKLLLVVIVISIIGLIAFSYQNTKNLAFANNSDITSIIEISKAEDFCNIAKDNYSNTVFKLINNIDLVTDTSWHSNVDDWQTSGWQPIDTKNWTDCTFDGGGYTIYNLAVSRNAEFTGFFSINGLSVKNLFIKNATVSNGENSGILAGQNDGQILNVHLEGTVSALKVGGGLVAENYGVIDNCSFEGDVAARMIGGLVGTNHFTVSNCLARGTLTGHIVGGLIAQQDADFEKLTVSTSFSETEIVENRQGDGALRLGAFIGVRDSGVIVESCFSIGDYPSVAYGESGGVETISKSESQVQSTYSNFDFTNYWSFVEGKLIQRDISIETTIHNSDGTETDNGSITLSINRKYYLAGEDAVTSVDNVPSNVGIKTFVLNGEEIDFVDNSVSVIVECQLNVEVTIQYLLFVQIEVAGEYGTATLNKFFFAPGEKIALTTNLEENAVITSIGGDIKLEFDSNGKYIGYAPNIEFTDVSVARVTISFGIDYAFFLIVAIVLIVLFVCVVIIACSKLGYQNIFSLLSMIMTVIFIGSLIIWILLVFQVISVAYQSILVVGLPVVILLCLFIEWALIKKYRKFLSGK